MIIGVIMDTIAIDKCNIKKVLESFAKRKIR